MYSNPPVHGARIAATIIGDSQLFAQWNEEMEYMAGRIKGVRKLLYDNLSDLNKDRDWSFVLSQIGMFSYSGMTGELESGFYLSIFKWKKKAMLYTHMCTNSLAWCSCASGSHNFKVAYLHDQEWENLACGPLRRQDRLSRASNRRLCQKRLK